MVKVIRCADCDSQLARENSFCMECYLRASCEASGVPRYVTDPVTIRQVASLLRPWTPPPPAKKTRGR